MTETPFKLVSAQRGAGTESMEPMAGAWQAVERQEPEAEGPRIPGLSPFL